MRIPQDKIEEVRAASDIVDVVGDYVALKQRGTNFFGLCPFHSEKTPSFSVNPSLGIYKCFGCGVAGDVFQFLMAIEQATFVEAVRQLAEKAGIALPEDDQGDELSSEADAIYHALRYAARFYYQSLTSGEQGSVALDYLRERGFRPETIKRFGLGYAPPGWSALLDRATRDHVAVEVLEKAGLVLARKDSSGHYDRFRDRITFPIISHMGKVVGFGARTMQAESGQPKYVNSPETSVYHKGRVLYGLYQARRAIRQEGETILVEGYTDVMALSQAGVEHVAATSGTALTTDQVKLLGRYAQRVVLLYDADVAGEAASARGLERVLEAGIAAYAVALPPGEDPDSLVRSIGRDAFQRYVTEHRQDFVAFRYGLAERNGMLDSPEGQTEAVGQLLDLVSAIADPIAQETYLRRTSEVTGMPQTTLWRALEQRRAARGAARGSAPERAPRPPLSPDRLAPAVEGRKPVASPERAGGRTLPSEETLLRLMVEHGEPMIEFILGHLALSEFTEGPARRAATKLLAQYESGTFAPRALLEESDDPELQNFIAGVMTDRNAPSKNWSRKLKIDVPRLNENEHVSAASAMTLLKLHRVQQEIERIREATYQAQESGADPTELQRQGMVLQNLRKQIERQEFINWPETAGRGTAG